MNLTKFKATGIPIYETLEVPPVRHVFMEDICLVFGKTECAAFKRWIGTDGGNIRPDVDAIPVDDVIAYFNRKQPF